MDVLGNHGLLDLLLHVATGHGDQVTISPSAIQAVTLLSGCTAGAIDIWPWRA